MNRHSMYSFNWKILMIFLIGSLINFLPLLIGFSLKNEDQYPDYLHQLSSFEFSASLVAGISANVPLLIIYIFDHCLRRIGFYGSSPALQFIDCSTNVYVPLRESIVFLLLSDVLLLFWLIPGEQYEIIMLLLDARDTMYTYLSLIHISEPTRPY